MELAGRKLEQVLDLDRLAWLADHEQALLVVGDHRHRTGMGDDLALPDRAVPIAEAVDPQRDDHPLIQRLRADPLDQSSPTRPVASASAWPEASAAAKKRRSRSSERPMTRVGSPLAA